MSSIGDGGRTRATPNRVDVETTRIAPEEPPPQTVIRGIPSAGRSARPHDAIEHDAITPERTTVTCGDDVP
ncbi:hypothetical protein DSY14_02555 [Nocardiopsis sp. MG754419]|nr:hypothetical protein [Nocardiopsis sp. MG754419]